MDGWMHGWMGLWFDGWTYMYGWRDGSLDGYRRISELMFGGWVGDFKDGKQDGWMDR